MPATGPLVLRGPQAVLLLVSSVEVRTPPPEAMSFGLVQGLFGMTSKPIVTAFQAILSTKNIDRLTSFYGELFGARSI